MNEHQKVPKAGSRPVRRDQRADAREPRPAELAMRDEAAAVDREQLTQIAILVIAVILIVTALSVGRSFFMPVLAATIVGISLSPLQRSAAKFHIPSVIVALGIVIAFFGLVWVVGMLVFGAVADWIARAPDLEQTIQQKLAYFERPLNALRELVTRMGGAAQGEGQKVSIETSLMEIARQALAVVQPALTEFLVFFGTLLFFLVGLTRLRRGLIVRFGTRQGRLRVMRIWNEIEDDLITYLGTVTVINFGVGAFTATMLYLLGFSNPIAIGTLAFVLNYIPYIGPAICTMIIAAISFVTYPTLSAALLPPALFIGFNVIEGNFLTPSIIGRRLTLSPFLVFVALAFWTWLWGPLGAFMATPILIIMLVVLGHIVPREDAELPK